MKQKTAIRQLIEQLDEELKSAVLVPYRNALHNTKALALKLESVNEQQIKDAVQYGNEIADLKAKLEAAKGENMTELDIALDRLKMADESLMRYNPKWGSDADLKVILNLISTAYYSINKMRMQNLKSSTN